jgi:hypothetical protein
MECEGQNLIELVRIGPAMLLLMCPCIFRVLFHEGRVISWAECYILFVLEALALGVAMLFCFRN